MNAPGTGARLHATVTASRVAFRAMATLNPHLLVPRPAADQARIRRWCLLAIAGAVLLAMYVGGVSWLTRQVEAGVDRSIQPLPTIVHDQPAA
jgi:hypothetical protein